LTAADRPVFEWLAAALVNAGHATMFGLVGDANIRLVHAFVADHAGTYIPAVHEAGAVLMAYGFAASGGGTGIATVTHGPGLTNTATALVEAAKARVPVVLIAGDTADADRHNLQNFDQRGFVLATGASLVQVGASRTATADLHRALGMAQTRSGPVVLNVPTELMHSTVDRTGDASRVPVPAPTPVAAEESIQEVAALLAGARRPLVLAGRGSITARGSVVHLARRLGAPLATTLGAKDLFRDDPADVGVFGTLSSARALDAIGRADCVVALGAGLNPFTTDRGRLLRGKTLVHVEADADRLVNSGANSVPVVADAGWFADRLVELLDLAEIPPSGFAAELLSVHSDPPGPPSRRATAAGTVLVEDALRAVEQAVPADRVLVNDAGRFLVHAWPLLRVRDPTLFVNPVRFGAIGTGMATAIGAAHAHRDRPTLLVTGDGGFMLGGLGELHCAVRDELDLIVVICNDSSYGAEYRLLREHGTDPALSLFAWPDFAAVARSFGATAVTVRSSADLAAMTLAIGSSPRPLVIDLRLDATVLDGPAP
jgi:thiamine pyrophosphate-dependent acetolactate synthase large subunit-like protein